jgi:DNA-binding NarL/FixJ family response regulator
VMSGNVEEAQVESADAAPPPIAVRSCGPFDKLTPRETQICRGMAVGVPYVDIAAALGISPKTVETFRGKLFAKLSCSNRVELARMALRHGFVSLDSDEWRS